MSPFTTNRRRGVLGVTAVVAAALGTGGIAVADNLFADGDTAVAGNNDSTLDFGSIPCDTQQTKSVPLVVSRHGTGTNVFKDSSPVTFRVKSGSVTGAGVSASDPSGRITIPSNWSRLLNGSLTDTVNGTINLRSTTAGAGTGKVIFEAVGVNGNNAALSRDDEIIVKWDTQSCAPPADTTLPTASQGIPDGAQSAYDGSWTNQDVAVKLDGSDDRAGVKIRYTLDGGDPTATTGTEVNPGTVLPFSAEQDRVLKFIAVDAAGNVSTPAVAVPIRIDNTAPSITAARVGSAANSNGWNNGDVVVGFTCNDNAGGSGLAAGACPGNVTKDAEGADQTASGTVFDRAGNQASATESNIKIDLTRPSAPTAAPDRNAEDADGGFFKDTVTVSYSGATDALSGIASQGTSETFSTSGTHDYSAKSTDKAGNESLNAVSGSVKVDATRPTVVRSAAGSCLNGTVVTVGEPVTAGWAASDNESGLATAASGQLEQTATLGSQSLIGPAGAATDKVGHTSIEVTMCSLRGAYASSGFLAPLAKLGVNTGKAGRTYPIKWRLMESVKQADGSQAQQTISDATGVALAQQMSFAQTLSGCESTALLDAIEEEAPATATTSISYDTAGDQFQMNYKAPSTIGCYRLTLYKTNGLQARQIDFKFTK